MNRIRGAAAASVVAVVTLTAGIALAAPLSESQWKQQGNAVCKQVNKDLKPIQQELFAGLGKNEDPSAEQISAYVEQFVPVIEDAVASIDALNEPKSLKSGVKKFKVAVADALATIEADPVAVLTGDTDPFVKANKVARKIGLKACAGG
ncbi:MAG: hypothetical protein MUP97_03330 [Acidimicrobiia bacterium]|nr:hypothetical protein [Acidimicrobiia bacterium]